MSTKLLTSKIEPHAPWAKIIPQDETYSGNGTDTCYQSIPSSGPLRLMYITNHPTVALIAEKYGVDRIWIDLETMGKQERQQHIDSVKSQHSIADIINIKPLLTQSELIVRVNPIHFYSQQEIHDVIVAGADIVMLPMWKSVHDVEQFIHYVDGKARTCLLLETKQAVECLDDVIHMQGIDEIYIGLNDLHLSYGLDFMFQPLANGLIDQLCLKIKAHGIPFGFGGIARIGEGLLPAEKIVMEHYRLGSCRAILSRGFCHLGEVTRIDEIEHIFKTNMQQLRAFEQKVKYFSPEQLSKNHESVIDCINTIVDGIRRRDRHD